MPAFVIVHRAADSTSDFTLYIAVTGTPEQAMDAVRAKFALDGSLEVNGRALSDETAAALNLSVGDVRPM